MALLPSLKLRRATVLVSGSDDRKEIAQLRARLAELEATDEDRQRAIDERYALGLQEERRSAVLRLQLCEAHDPGTHELLADPFSAQGGDTRSELSWGQRAAQARAHIGQIDAELERVGQRAD